MEYKDTVKRGTAWTTISTISVALAQLLRISILTRFLDKADFGVMAIITFVMGLTYTFSDLGFASAIMHKKDISKSEFSSLFWIQFLLFALFYLLALLISPYISNFYEEPSLSYLIPIALIDLFFLGIGKLYDVVLQKQFQFKTIAIRNIVSVCVSLVVAVVFAYYGWGIYSLVMSTLLQSAVLYMWNFCSGQKYYQLQFRCSILEVRPLLKIGFYQMCTQLLDYMSSRLDILILGKSLGTDLLGVYNLAKELVLKVVVIINTVANKVSLPIFSHMQDNVSRLRENYLHMLKILVAIVFPCCFLFSVCSPIIVYLFYGNSYMEVTKVIPILSVWACFVCIMNPVANVIIAMGRTDLSLKYTCIRLFYAFPVVLIISKYGLLGVAISQIVLSIIDCYVSFKVQLQRILQLSMFEYVSTFKNMLFIVSVLVAVFYFSYTNNIFHLDTQWTHLSFYSIFAIFLFVLPAFTLQKETYSKIFKIIVR